MITEAELYWMTRLDNIRTFFTVFISLGGISFMLLLLMYLVTLEDDYESTCKTIGKLLMIPIAVFVVSAMGLTFTPTTKEMTAIKVIPMIVNSDTALKLKDGLKDSTSNLIDLTNSYIKNKLNIDKNIIEEKKERYYD